MEADLIRYMSDTQEEHFARLDFLLGIDGRRLQLIDCQNLFCEVDKYARWRIPRSPATRAEPASSSASHPSIKP